MRRVKAGQKARTIMVQGTASHVGKSAVATALCRIFARDGYRVAPFKSWNMALNSYVTQDGGEIGRAQGEQAEAAGIEATVHMNPILVKPKGQGQAQVIVRGRARGDVDFAERSEEDYVQESLQLIGESLEILRDEYEIVVLEGAGSPAEINLLEQDVANMKAAALAEAPVLLVSDIDRGGALAAAVGTMLLLPEADRRRVAGFVFNKFRGDITLLEPGLAAVQEKTGVATLGVIPYLDKTGLAEEDGVALECLGRAGEREGCLKICVVRLPHIANFTDFDVLKAEIDVALSFVGVPGDLIGADAVILPGTKNSMRDLLFLRQTGLDQAIIELVQRGVPVVGICGGYQLLGQTLEDPRGAEAGGEPGNLPGLGLLAVKTYFYPKKRVMRVSAVSKLPFAAQAVVSGYEIHMGQTVRQSGCRAAFVLTQGGMAEDGARSDCGQIWGTYIHGVFDKPGFRRPWLNTLRKRRGWQDGDFCPVQERGNRFDALAGQVRHALDMAAIYQLLGLPGPKRS